MNCFLSKNSKNHVEEEKLLKILIEELKKYHVVEDKVILYISHDAPLIATALFQRWVSNE